MTPTGTIRIPKQNIRNRGALLCMLCKYKDTCQNHADNYELQQMFREADEKAQMVRRRIFRKDNKEKKMSEKELKAEEERKEREYSAVRERYFKYYKSAFRQHMRKCVSGQTHWTPEQVKRGLVEYKNEGY